MGGGPAGDRPRKADGGGGGVPDAEERDGRAGEDDDGVLRGGGGGVPELIDRDGRAGAGEEFALVTVEDAVEPVLLGGGRSGG